MTSRDLDYTAAAIGRRLVAAREVMGLTQTAMAAATGISQQRLGTYERGERFPPVDFLARFWLVSGATSDFILFGMWHTLPYDLARRLEMRKGGRPDGAAEAS